MAGLSLTNASATNKAVLDRYMRLPLPDDKVMATYIWIDGTGEYVRAKTKTIDFIPKHPSGNEANVLFPFEFYSHYINCPSCSIWSRRNDKEIGTFSS